MSSGLFDAVKAKFVISFLEGVGQMTGAIAAACAFILAVKLMMVLGVV